jgi:Ca2+-binding RTX toxin-like protein
MAQDTAAPLAKGAKLKLNGAGQLQPGSRARQLHSTKDTVSRAVAADLIEGLGGPDILIGGTGADTFISHAGFGGHH